MTDYAYINAHRLPDVMLKRKLTGSEMKMMFAILFYLSSNSSKYFFNNLETREYLASVGLNLTRERICGILSGLVKKGVIKREAQSVYSVDNSLYLPTEAVDVCETPQ